MEVDEEIYDEMHVDGSVYYAIVDGEIDPNPMQVHRRLKPITERTISTMIKVSAWSSLYRMYLHAKQRGYQFRFVGLPDYYEPEVPEPYNQAEMKKNVRYRLRDGAVRRCLAFHTARLLSGPVFHVPKAEYLECGGE